MRRISSSLRVTGYLLLVLIVATVAGLVLFSKTKGKAKSDSPETTRINEASFRLTLPGTWTSGPSNDPTSREYHTTSEGLTVSILGSLFGAPGTMNHDDRVAMFTRWVNKRRNFETKVTGGDTITSTEPLFGESGGVLATRYAGFDGARQRRFHCLLLASSSVFEILYYEALDMSEQAAEEQAKAIFNSVDIPR